MLPAALSNEPAQEAHTDHFQALAAETTLQILSNLPVKEIVQARRISCQFRELINAPLNQQLLFNPIQIRNQLRIRQSVADLIHFDPKDGLLETFARYIAHRVHWERVNGRETLAPTYIFNRDPRHDVRIRDVRYFLEDLMREHIRTHRVHDRHRIEGFFLRSPFSSGGGGTRRALQDLQLDEHDLHEILLRIRNTPGGYFTTNVHKDTEAPLKPIIRPHFYGDEVATKLGIPDISSMAFDFDDSRVIDLGFHYCLDRGPARDQLLRIYSGEELSPRDMALILEQTYLH